MSNYDVNLDFELCFWIWEGRTETNQINPEQL